LGESKYEKYVIRKPAIIQRVGDQYVDFIPESDKLPLTSPEFSGARTLFSKTFMEEAKAIVEYCLISGDVATGTGADFEPHKHNYEEIFLFLGTNPEDTTDLGAEVEFWLGEGEDLEKVTLTTSSCVYVPAHLAHFPQIWRNVKRPVVTVVIVPVTEEKEVIAVPRRVTT
jgi:hypothetical protein